MAIDPKLVSIIPASQLPTGDPTSAADFLFFEGDALKKGSMSNIYDRVTSGIKGVATQTNAPTVYTAEAYPNGLTEIWRVFDPLTSPNSWGNISVTQAELNANDIYFVVTNGVVAKKLSPKTIADPAKIVTWTATTFASGVQVLYKSKLWESTGATTAADIPGISLLWFDVLGSLGMVKKSVVDTAGNVFVSPDIDTNGDVYVGVMAAGALIIYKNAVLLKSWSTAAYNSGLVSIAIKKKDNLIHILIGTSTATAPSNGLAYIQYNVTAETFTDKGLLTTGANEKLSCYSITEFGGELYSAVNIDGLSNGTSWDLASARKRIDLFKLVGETWTKQNVISTYNEEWGARFTISDGVTVRDALDTPIVPTNGTIFVNEKGNLGAYFSSSLGAYNNRVFSKELISGTWKIERIENISKAVITYAWVDKFGKRRLFMKKHYTYNNVWTQTRQVITTAGNGKAFFEISKNIDELGAVAYRDGKVVYASRRTSGRYYVEQFEITDETVLAAMVPEQKRKIGDAVTSTNPTTAILQYGDYYEATEAGTYGNFLEALTLSVTVNIPIYMTVRLGEKARFIWNGFGWVKSITVDENKSALVYPVLQGFAQQNEFGSKTFRIPVIAESIKGTLILAADARRTSASDYAEMDGVVCRSADGGKTFTDHVVVFKRNAAIDGARVHDLGLTVDANPASAQYGRIWAFAKEWLANIDPNANMAYFVSNPDKSTFWISYSDDDGKTWAAPTERKDLYKVGAWHLSSGCAAGLTLTDGTLIQPVYWGYSATDMRAGFLKKAVGGNWEIGNEIPSSFGNTNENSIIQDIDGKLIMNARTTGLTRKVFELSTLAGTWVNRPDLEVWQDVIGGCQNSFVRYRNTYLYVQPTLFGTTARKFMKVFISYDKINWQPIYQLTGDVASGGYSSIVATDSNFAVVYENTEANAGINFVGLEYLRNLLR